MGAKETALHKMRREQNYANNSAKKFIQLFLMFVKSKSAAAFFIMLLAELNLQHNPPSQLSPSPSSSPTPFHPTPPYQTPEVLTS